MMPVLFLSHGSPTMPFDNVPARDFLMRLGSRLPRPQAILCVSAHWEAALPSITASRAPATIHDFHGFPDALYDLQYDVPGDPELAARIAAMLEAGGINALQNSERGLDHGAWSPLMLIYPQSDIPVLQLSLIQRGSPLDHIAVGRLLASLRREGILLVASGGAVHNLRAVEWNGRAAPPDWAQDFDCWLQAAIASGDLGVLADYRRQSAAAPLAHPTEEHLMPVFVALGAAAGTADKAPGRQIHASFTFGSLGMAAYAWGLD
ncbi:4,5-DOPA dioxygenase extradiol [Dongia mobilis]|uniref:4,5-DOPA dioxygenase extradiol n=2 Tax=Dongia mobilis TaxID=578943 RepID=A0A4R6WK90_9PROT|nr:4,5-DOPA dioxygenase extradiol [Dongia mobilis]